jgi:5-methylcytosine-specific restriction protein A
MRLVIPSEYSQKFKTGKPVISLTDGTEGYRTGYAYHKVYDSLNLPTEQELHDDLFKMLEAYEAVYLNGGRNLDDEKVNKSKMDSHSFEADEEAYQNPPPKRKIKESPKTADIKDEERSSAKNSKSNVRPRNPDHGEEAKQKANYKCEISEFHETFKRKTDGNDYTEAHHLIPYEQYDFYADMDLCIDRTFNIVSLCPNCHRKIHHGKKEDISHLLEKLFNIKRKALVDIYVCDLETLRSFYKIK